MTFIAFPDAQRPMHGARAAFRETQAPPRPLLAQISGDATNSLLAVDPRCIREYSCKERTWFHLICIALMRVLSSKIRWISGLVLTRRRNWLAQVG